MKLIKYIFTLLVGATALSLTSCNDFLDRDPLGQFTEDDSPNALVGGKIFNVYYLMRSYDITAGIPAFMVHMVRSEDSEKGSDAGDGRHGNGTCGKQGGNGQKLHLHFEFLPFGIGLFCLCPGTSRESRGRASGVNDLKFTDTPENAKQNLSHIES